MEKEFVPYGIALALKELGFDEECAGCYEDDNMELLNIGVIDKTSSFTGGVFGAPLYQQAFRWFEETHSMFIDRVVETTPNEIIGIEYHIKSWKFKPIEVEFERLYDELDLDKAQLACLNKLIEIVKDGLQK
jgi:hypothetical protein